MSLFKLKKIKNRTNNKQGQVLYFVLGIKSSEKIILLALYIDDSKWDDIDFTEVYLRQSLQFIVYALVIFLPFDNKIIEGLMVY